MEEIAPGPACQTLTLILNEQQSQKCIHLAKESEICGGIVLLGWGTVKSAILNLLGIKSQRKVIITYLLAKDKAEAMLELFTATLQLEKPGHGIAFTAQAITFFPAAGNSLQRVPSTQEKAPAMKGEHMFNKLTVIVDRGMAEEVMEIARRAGAKGGTILHGRGTGAEYTAKLLGMEIEPEKELVIILMPGSLVDQAVSDLTKELQLSSPGKGILFVEPIVEVRGLFEAQ